MTDLELIELVKNKLKEIFVPDKHFVVAAFKTASGKVFFGYNFKATSSKASLCAEGNALFISKSLNEDVDVIVTMRLNDSGEVIIVSPCGSCRELLRDYAPNAKIILEDHGELKKLKIKELLPFPYIKE